MRYCLSLAIAVLIPALGYGQGIRMSPDFLPLEAGNLWRYEVADAGGQITGRFEMEILEHRIVEGASLYVFSRFPLAPDGAFDEPVGVRFDGRQRQYVYTDGQQEGDLFPSGGAAAEVLETDDAGVARTVRIRYPERSLTLERGLGIRSATQATPAGPQTVTLVGARVGNEVFGEAERLTAPPVLAAEPPVDNVVLPSDTEPVLEVEAAGLGGGHRFTLRVRNPTDRLMAFDFTTSQSFDFVVSDPETGQEIWRWSRRMFFSQVKRSEAIRAGGQWEYEAEWNHRDNDLEPVPPGTYRVSGILSSETSFESEPIEFEVR